MITTIDEYCKYMDGIRKRTMQYVKNIPDTMLDWRPQEDKFTTGDILRHLGSTQLMFLQAFENGDWTYIGHDKDKGATIEAISSYLEECQQTFITGLKKLGNDALSKKIKTLHGHEISGWRMLMAVAEHEIHHRGQVSTYLQINEVAPPQIFGLKIEQVKNRNTLGG